MSGDGDQRRPSESQVREAPLRETLGCGGGRALATGLEAVALADEAGVNERTIQRLERGEKVNEETVRKVLSALRLSLKERPRSRRTGLPLRPSIRSEYI